MGKKNPLSTQAPFVKGSLTRLKLVLPCTKTRAWHLVGTPKGLASWFPTHVKGQIRPGKVIEFGWTSGTENHRVLNVKKGESWQMDWWEKGRVRYSVNGSDPTIFTLETRYPKKGQGKEWQVQELASWSFFLGNLKSRSMKGPDLRNKSTKYTWKKGFVDS